MPMIFFFLSPVFILIPVVHIYVYLDSLTLSLTDKLIGNHKLADYGRMEGSSFLFKCMQCTIPISTTAAGKSSDFKSENEGK